MNAALTRVYTATALMVGRSTRATAKLASQVYSVKTKPMSVVLTRALVGCVLTPSCPTRVCVVLGTPVPIVPGALTNASRIRACMATARIESTHTSARATSTTLDLTVQRK